MIQNFTGLAGLIFEINGKNWPFFAIKTYIDEVMLRIIIIIPVLVMRTLKQSGVHRIL